MAEKGVVRGFPGIGGLGDEGTKSHRCRCCCIDFSLALLLILLLGLVLAAGCWLLLAPEQMSLTTRRTTKGRSRRGWPLKGGGPLAAVNNHQK